MKILALIAAGFMGATSLSSMIRVNQACISEHRIVFDTSLASIEQNWVVDLQKIRGGIDLLAAGPASDCCILLAQETQGRAFYFGAVSSVEELKKTLSALQLHDECEEHGYCYDVVLYMQRASQHRCQQDSCVLLDILRKQFSKLAATAQVHLTVKKGNGDNCSNYLIVPLGDVRSSKQIDFYYPSGDMLASMLSRPKNRFEDAAITTSRVKTPCDWLQIIILTSGAVFACGVLISVGSDFIFNCADCQLS